MGVQLCDFLCNEQEGTVREEHVIMKTGFPKDKLRQTILFIKEHYGVMPFNCKQYERLYEFMKHDKKNSAGIINFTLLTEIGNIQINQSASKDEIFEMLDFYHESMGC